MRAATPDATLQIGEVAARTGLSLKTIRYYEEVGLLTPARRSQGGFRLYTDVAVERLLVIRRMKPLEFTLAEMRSLLETIDTLAERSAGSVQSEELQERLTAFRTEMSHRIARLRRRLADAEDFEEVLERYLAAP